MRIRNTLLIKSAGRLGYAILSSLFATVRKEIHVAEMHPYEKPGPQPALFAVWHDSSVMAGFCGRTEQMAALTSQHSDGSFVESILRPMGVQVVRGSTSRGGSKALREMLEIASRKNIVLTPDGPRGPRRTMSRGLVYLASKTGNPIVPAAFACNRYWQIKSSWTSHTLPQPFSRVVLLVGAPIWIPAGVSPSRLGDFQESVQAAMEELQGRADRHILQPLQDPLGIDQLHKLPEAA